MKCLLTTFLLFLFRRQGSLLVIVGWFSFSWYFVWVQPKPLTGMYELIPIWKPIWSSNPRRQYTDYKENKSPKFHYQNNCYRPLLVEVSEKYTSSSINDRVLILIPANTIPRRSRNCNQTLRYSAVVGSIAVFYRDPRRIPKQIPRLSRYPGERGRDLRGIQGIAAAIFAVSWGSRPRSRWNHYHIIV